MSQSNGLSYEYTSNIKVKLEGKYIGDIKEVIGCGFAYFPKGCKDHGEVFESQAAVMSTL